VGSTTSTKEIWHIHIICELANLRVRLLGCQA
jgi:hypothetical protein